MLKVNDERLSRIKQLRARGATIDQIAASTGIPRSSVGHYVKKYCGGRTRAGKPQSDESVRSQVQRVVMVEPTPQADRVESYMQRLEAKERLSLDEVLKGKRIGDPSVEEPILDMLQKDPDTLNVRLIVIERLIRLAPFLKIGMDNIRDMIGILLTEPRGATSSASTGLQQQSRQNVEKGSGKLSEIFPNKDGR